MKIVDRYLSRQIIVNLLFAIVVLSFVLVIGNIFRKLLPLLVNHDLPVDYLIGFVAYVLPFSLIFTIPWGLLTAVLLVFGRLSADNELTALRSNGVSIARICVPLVVIALACTAASLWLNVQVAPAAQEEMRSTVFNLATRNPMALFGSDQVIDQFPGRKIYVGRKEGNKLENILVFETNDESMPMKVTHAREGSLEADLPNRRILMHLYNARYSQRDEVDPYDLRRMRDGISVEEGTLPISLEDLYEKEKRRASRSMLSLEQLLVQPHRNQQAIFLPDRLSRFRAGRRSARHHCAPPRNFLRVRRQPAHRRLLFPLHHRRRYVADEPQAASRVSRLVPERIVSRLGLVALPAVEPAVDASTGRG